MHFFFAFADLRRLFSKFFVCVGTINFDLVQLEDEIRMVAFDAAVPVQFGHHDVASPFWVAFGAHGLASWADIFINVSIHVGRVNFAVVQTNVAGVYNQIVAIG